jgi:hypothetical protein
MDADKDIAFTLDGERQIIPSATLRFYKSLCPLNFRARMSTLIWIDIVILDRKFGIAPQEVIKAIQDVEDGEPATGLKPASQFKNLPLKGLWHKHYFSSRFYAHNLLLGMGKDGLEKIIYDEIKLGETITEEALQRISYRASREGYESRHNKKKLTGEWVIFSKYNNENYYLCCSSHTDDDQEIYDRIIAGCLFDFPNLTEWITESSGS